MTTMNFMVCTFITNLLPIYYMFMMKSDATTDKLSYMDLLTIKGTLRSIPSSYLAPENTERKTQNEVQNEVVPPIPKSKLTQKGEPDKRFGKQSEEEKRRRIATAKAVAIKVENLKMLSLNISLLLLEYLCYIIKQMSRLSAYLVAMALADPLKESWLELVYSLSVCHAPMVEIQLLKVIVLGRIERITQELIHQGVSGDESMYIIRLLCVY